MLWCFGALVRTSYTPIIRGTFINIGSKSGWSSFSITGPYRTGITEVSHYRAVFGTCHNPRTITCPAPVTPDDIYSNLIFVTTAPDTVTVYNASGSVVGKNKMYGLRTSGSNNNWFKLYQPLSESHRSSSLDISSYKVTFKDGSVKNRLNSYYNCTLTIIDQGGASSFDVREPTYWNLSNLSYSDEPDILTNNRRGASHLHMLCVPKTPAIIKSVKADLYIDYFNLAHF